MSRSRILILLGLILLMTVPTGVVLAQQFEGSGTGIISDGAALGDRLVITMTDVTPPAQNTFYEGWLVSDDGNTKLSLGPIQVRGGNVNHTFISAEMNNLIDVYRRLVITVEPVPDPDPGPSDVVAFSDTVPQTAMGNIRTLLVRSAADTMNGDGILTALKRELDLAITHANLARNSSDIATLRQHLEHTVNIIEGGAGRDVDGNGTPQNPGDGVGVIPYATSGNTQASAAIAVGARDAAVVNGGNNVRVNLQNVINWGNQARDLAEQTVGENSLTVAKLRIGPGANSVISFLEAARRGFDANGNGTIQSISGEGGTNQAYIQAQRMATYNINPGVSDDPGLPPVGDIAVPLVAQFALIFGAAFLGIGGVLLFRSRRSRRASA